MKAVTQTEHTAPAPSAAPHGRPSAGQDPVKRAQILDGAGRVVSQMGFDAASMNDIAREAGVSKGTIYVYFANKEDLFEALMEETRQRIFRDLEAELGRPGDLAERLFRYGVRLCSLLCSEKVVQAHRVMIGVAERMPELSKSFYDRGAGRGTAIITNFLEAEVAAGHLNVPDIQLAAYQFADLAVSGLFRRRLLRHLPEPPSREEIERVVRAATEMFLRYYGTGTEAPATTADAD